MYLFKLLYGLYFVYFDVFCVSHLPEKVKDHLNLIAMKRNIQSATRDGQSCIYGLTSYNGRIRYLESKNRSSR